MYYLIINAKAYTQSVGTEFKEVVDACFSLRRKAKKKNVELILVPQYSELKDSIQKKISTFSQHVDPIFPGSNTGFIAPDNMKKIGCDGTLINHSEHTLQLEIIKQTIERSKDAGLKTCVCARTPKAVEVISDFKPDFIALEPPELIGGDVSVTTKPELIIEAKTLVGSIPLLVGAGVKTTDDVRKAVELGAEGILVASGVIKAQNKKKAIEDLLEGF